MKTIVTTDGRELKRISRWIKLQHNYNPTKRNSLWDYVDDENGHHPCHQEFNPKGGLYLDYFRYNGKTYALEQFYCIGSAFLGGIPPMYEDENSKLGVIGTLYMDGPIFGPALYAEWSEDCEYVRLYESK